MTQWTEPRPEHSGAYAFIERLPIDAPPTLLTVLYVGDDALWSYWTVAGWATLTSRVCICERPEEE